MHEYVQVKGKYIYTLPHILVTAPPLTLTTVNIMVDLKISVISYLILKYLQIWILCHLTFLKGQRLQ